MPDNLTDLADTAFNALGASLTGAGVEVQQAWNAVLGHKQTLTLGAEQTAATLAAINEEPSYTPGKAERSQMQLDIFDSVHRASTAGLQSGFDTLRASLEKAARADLAPSTDSTARLLLRSDIDAFVGKDVDISALLRVAQDPKYTAEVAEYGPVLLARAGKADRAPEIMRGILAAIPATTPKAQSARQALKLLDKTVGHVAGLSFSTRQRVEATQPNNRAGRTDNLGTRLNRAY